MLKINWRSSRTLIMLVWIVAIAIRLYGASTPAQYYDIGTYEAWSRSFWTHGPKLFFSSVWSDYLPLPILTFAPISLISDFFHIPFGPTFKLIHSALELLLIALIPSVSFLPKAMLLLSAALIGDTSFWGQVDTIPALLVLLSLTTTSPIMFGLAVAYKPIMILIAPILWIKDIKKDRYWQLPLISMVVFFATAIPTGGTNFIAHIFERIFSQTGTYPYLSINAFNIWTLVPINSWIPDSIRILNISGRALGFAMFAFFSLFTLNNWRKTKFSPKYVAKVAGIILICFYAFTTRMHERHLLFGLPFLTLAVATESWLIIPLALLTTTFTVNLYGAFYWVSHAQTWPYSELFISLTSWVTILTTAALSLVWDWPQLLVNLKNIFIKNKVLIAILLLATILRFGNLSYPTTYIFDEVYHAFTAREYVHNHIEAWEWWTTPPKDVAYEWTHPPVAKYGMVVGMLLFGENSFGWRVGSSVAGVVSILGLYLLILVSTKNKQLALLSVFLVNIEGIHIAQSRIAMNDMYMFCFFVWSLYLAVKSRWKGSALLYGLALATKWSALYGIIPLAFIYLHNNKLSLRSILLAFRLVLITASIYVLSFAPFILAGHTWAQWWELHRQMWYYHTHLVATHGYQSTPLQWIFSARPVWYYVKYLGDNISNIYVQGNPIILWLGLVSVVLQLKKLLDFRYSIFFVLYIIFTLPWIASPRIMFFYHYLPSSVFLCVILANWLLDQSRKSIFNILVLCSLSLLLISPMLYGYPMSHVYWDTLFKLLPSWK